MSFLEYPRPCCLKNIIQFLSSLASYSLQININAYFYSIDVTKIFVLLNFYCNIYLHKINHNIFLTYMLYNTYTNYIVIITKSDVFYISYQTKYWTEQKLYINWILIGSTRSRELLMEAT